ncbi:RNA polymerase sigma factor (sigma-70 family) [Streptomyces sp. TE33382]
MREPEDDLRRRVRAGEREAFAELYEQCARRVYRHALRLTGDWSTAEEVMSETFLAAWHGRERVVDGEGSLLPWLLGIATHKCENARRGLRRRLAFLARQPQPAPVADFAPETVGRLDDLRRLRAVRDVLQHLRRQEREVLSLCVWSGPDYQQTAEALGVPVGTVRSRLSRGPEEAGRAHGGKGGTHHRPRRDDKYGRTRGPARAGGDHMNHDDTHPSRNHDEDAREIARLRPAPGPASSRSVSPGSPGSRSSSHPFIWGVATTTRTEGPPRGCQRAGRRAPSGPPLPCSSRSRTPPAGTTPLPCGTTSSSTPAPRSAKRT